MYTFELDFISSTYRYKKKKALHPFIHLNANVSNSFVDFFVSKWHLKYFMIFFWLLFYFQHYSFNPFVESVVSSQLCVLYTFASPHFLSPQEYDDIVVVYAGTWEGLKIQGGHLVTGWSYTQSVLIRNTVKSHKCCFLANVS